MTQSNSSLFILMYHKLAEESSDFIPALNTKVFQKQIKFIKRFYNVVPLENITEQSSSKETRICITFDDGYASFYKYGYPLLNKYHLPATVFLSVESIEKNVPIWPDLISYYISTTKKIALELTIQGKKINFRLNDKGTKLSSSTELKLLLKQMNNTERLILLKQIKGDLATVNPDIEKLRMLSWPEIREMSKNGVSFGAHTLTHPILTKVSLDEAKNEILESKKIIEERIGKSVTTFAYPNGGPSDFNEGIKKILREGGFQSACTTIFGRNYQKTNPYELKRIYASGNSILKFALRLWKTN